MNEQIARDLSDDAARLRWVGRVFGDLTERLIHDFKFALLYDCTETDGEFVRNSRENPLEPTIEPFWDLSNNSAGVAIGFDCYQTNLRTCGDMAMEPRALRHHLYNMCNDFCPLCECGNMATLAGVGTFARDNEAYAIAWYFSNPVWPRENEAGKCNHWAIAEARHRTMRLHLARIAFEQEIRGSMPRVCTSRYNTDRAFVLIMCQWTRDVGHYVRLASRDIWKMIRRMIVYGVCDKNRFDEPNPNAIMDWSYLYPFVYVESE